MKRDQIEEVLRGSRQWAYLKGDSEEIVTMLPPFSIDAQISDPPYPGIKGIEKNDDCAAKGIAALVTHEMGENQ